MDGVTDLPEPFAAGKLLSAFLLPSLLIAPNPYRRMTVIEVHHAAGIQRCSCWQCHTQFRAKTLVASAEFKPGNLGRPSVKDVGAAAEGASASTALLVGFQQAHLLPMAGQ